ncbi:GIY-YIG nuclease family protein [Candidatus Dojkabacteria bacterium]|uniref:GIY-YIG nuclease family protein n=1 Tax=Candidatus Dojkabacteria bacterium TaxID=2099670 RepID=A0A955L6F7_9BACT|nr:GIY-YIG nuclease family protein [Candidatus Dojkabacteria bacterium]
MFVYILFSKNIDRFYVGMSNNPDRRLIYHNIGKGGGNAFTKRAHDWQIVFTQKFVDKQSASKFETHIKTQKSRRYIKSLIKNKAPR